MTPIETGQPVRKVAIGGAAGVVVFVIIMILNEYIPFFQTKPITAEMASGLSTLLTFLASYFTPPARSETVIEDIQGDMKSATR